VESKSLLKQVKENKSLGTTRAGLVFSCGCFAKAQSFLIHDTKPNKQSQEECIYSLSFREEISIRTHRTQHFSEPEAIKFKPIRFLFFISSSSAAS
jgi:hypothetical protein